MLIDNKDALTAVDDCNYKIMSGYEWIRKQEIKKRLKELPSAEPQIIRCKDCKHSYDDIGGTYCSYGVCVDCVVEEDFFCRDGERREEE